MRGCAAVLALLALCSQAFQEVASAQERPWTVEDVLAFRSPGQIAMSPDGKWVAYVVSYRNLDEGKNASDIWVVATEDGKAFQLTRGDGSERSPAWAPDGSWLAFLSGRDGPVQVYGIRPDAGEAWKVTASKQGVGSFRLSPDGMKIAFTAQEEESIRDKELAEVRGRPMVWDSAYATEYVHLWVGSLREGEALDVERSSPDSLSLSGFDWAPDSRGLVWSAAGKADHETSPSRDRRSGFSRESNVYVQDEPGAPPRRVATMRGGQSPEAWIAGLGIIVSGTGSELGTHNRQLWLVQPEVGGTPMSLTEGLDEHAGYVAASVAEVLVQAQYRTGSRLYRIPLRNRRPAGPPEVLSDDRLLYSGFSSSRDMQQVAFLAQGPTTPPAIHLATLQRFAPLQLTELNPEAAGLALGEQRVIRWASEHDGEEIEGVLTLPVNYEQGQRVPLLLIIHGGPAAVSSNGFNPGGRYASQVFSGLGYATLHPNYRGSTGYGERFRALNRGHISAHDWIDVDSGVNYLIRQGIADPERLGIMGWSFGGHHTFWGITQTDRFKAASAGAGANDLISMYSQTDLPGFYHTYLGPRPWEDFGLYEERSAYRFVERVTTPLLILVGENDRRVPAEQSIQFYEAMTGLRKAPVKLVIYPGEGHGLQDVGHVRDMMQRNVDWFTHWIPLTSAAPGGEYR